MKTEIIKLDRDNISLDDIKKASIIIRQGDLVAFPTETVYGLGANGLDEGAVKKIYKAKGRPSDNPLILHISDLDQLDSLVDSIPDQAKLCMDRFWPGPLTLIFKKSSLVPNIITAGLDTVAIRMPENKIAKNLISEAGVPIAAPSANRSGRPSPTKASHVYLDLEGRIPLILDGGSTGVGLESTVLDLSGDIPIVLRPGGITLEDLRGILPRVDIDKTIVSLSEDMVPKSPGQKYKHYAPKAEMQIYEGDLDQVVSRINKDALDFISQGKKVGVMCTDETESLYNRGVVISMGKRSHKETIAHNLFTILRDMDGMDVDIILSESINKDGIGIAIMNRMLKAAGGKVISV